MTSAVARTPAAEARAAGLRSPASRFVVRFAAFALAGFVAYGFPYAPESAVSGWFESYLRAYAEVVAAVLSLFESELVVNGTTLIGRTTIQVVRSCDAMDANILLASAILASEGSRARKLFAVVLALAFVAVLNVTRIVSLYFALVHYPGCFGALHLEVWPLILLLAAGAAFLVSLGALRGHR